MVLNATVRSQVTVAMAALLLMTSLSACSRGRTLEWQQEVRLHDGRVIIVDRLSKQTGSLTPDGAILEYEQVLTFSHPDTGERMSWALPKGVGVWMLDFEHGIPYFVLEAKSVTDYNDWGCPNPPWIVYRYGPTGWDRVAIGELPARFTKPNMLLAARTHEKSSGDGLVTVAELDAYLRRIDRQYQVISREKVNPIGKGCYPDTLSQYGRESEMMIGYEQEGKK